MPPHIAANAMQDEAKVRTNFHCNKQMRTQEFLVSHSIKNISEINLELKVYCMCVPSEGWFSTNHHVS